MTISITHFDTCLSCYVTDWSRIVVGITPRGQSIDDAADEMVDEINIHEDAWTVDDDEIRTACVEALQGADLRRFDDNGNRVENDVELPDDDSPEVSQLWFRVTIEEPEFTVLVEEHADDPHCSAVVSVRGEGARRWAKNQQSIGGSSWECDGDDFAYTIVSTYPGCVDDWRAEGYDLDLSLWNEPTKEEQEEAMKSRG